MPLVRLPVLVEPLIRMILLSRIILILTLLGSCRAQVCPSLVIPLNVFTRDGLLARSLSLDNLVIKIDGKEAKLNSVGLDVNPRRVVLLLDTSASMAGHGPGSWKLVPLLGAYAVDTIPSDASVAVGTIAKVPTIGEFGDRAQAGARVLALTRSSIKGSTALFDSIHAALIKLGQPHFGDLIYIITDGGDNHSKLTEPQIVRELSEHGTRVFVLLVSSQQPRIQEEQLGPAVMEDLAKQSGGHLMVFYSSSAFSANRADLLKTASLIQSDIRTTYRVEVSYQKKIKKPASVQVRYTGPDQRLAKNSAWIYPRRVGPCPH